MTLGLHIRAGACPFSFPRFVRAPILFAIRASAARRNCQRLTAFIDHYGTAWAGVRHFGIESNLLLEADVILPTAFNDHVVGVMTKRHPFIIIDTRTRFEGRWYHENFVPIIQRLVRHSSVAVGSSSTFGQEPTK